jgi:SAM-dependent methyltransferase
MITEIDFFSSSGPRSATERERKIAAFVPDAAKRSDFLSYGSTYYDGADYGVGYGVYRYDGRYGSSVEKIIAHYKLSAGAKILEIGCAKGFILYEFWKRGMAVAGMDISGYAVANAIDAVRPFIAQGSCERVPWDSDFFDLVYCKETLPHLAEDQLRQTIPEMQRVCKSDNILLDIQVSENERGRALMKIWDETQQSCHGAGWWRALLGELKFRGQVNFKPLF